MNKSSFTLHPSEASLVLQLKKQLRLSSNTAVIRQALLDLKKRLERDSLRKQFREASLLARKANQEEMNSLDELAHEGLGED